MDKYFPLKSKLYTEYANSVQIVKYQLLLDTETNETLLQTVLHNNTDKVLTNCQYALVCYDSDNKVIDKDCVVSLDNLNVPPHFNFGAETLTKLTDGVRNVEIEIQKVSDSEGEIALNNGINYAQSVSSPTASQLDGYGSAQLLEEMFNSTSTSVIDSIKTLSYPIVKSDIWQCFCGKVNGKDDVACANCGRLKILAEKIDKDVVSKKYSEICARIDEQNEKEAQLKQQAEAEQQRRQAEEIARQAAEKQAKDTADADLINSTVIEIKSKRIVLSDRPFIKRIKKALSCYNKGNDNVKSMISDSAALVEADKIIKSAQKTRGIIAGASAFTACVAVFMVFLFVLILPTQSYNKALTLYEQGQYDKAEEIFRQLNNFKDSKSKLELAQAKGLSFILKEDGYHITKYKGSETEVVVPSQFVGVNVVAIDDGAFENTAVVTVTLPDTITVIGVKAFNNCVALKSINLPNGLLGIGDDAFANCALMNVCKIPTSVKQIGDRAFFGCERLGAQTFGDSLSSIGSQAFYNCRNFTTAKLPSALTTLGQGAFYGCISLSNVTIPNGVTVIENQTFYGCTNLVAVAFNSNLTQILDNAFFGCANLTNVTIPKNVTILGKGCFSSCTKLTSMTILGTPQLLPDNFLSGCTKLKYVSLPSSVSELGKNAFANCSSLTSINLAYVSNLGTACFLNCKGLTELNLPSRLSIIPDEAFSGCSGITNVSTTISLKFIGARAFYGCVKMESFGKNTLVQLTTVGSEAFYGCAKLLVFRLPAGVTEVGSKAFYNCNILNLYCVSAKANLPSGWSSDFTNQSYSVFYSATTNTNKEIVIDRIAIDGFVLALDEVNHNAHLTNYGGTAQQISIPDVFNIPNIGSYTLTKIKAAAFASSAVKEVVIPSTVTEIEQEAFKLSSSLVKIYIPNSVLTMGGNVFFGCTNGSLSIRVQAVSKPSGWQNNWYGNVSVSTIRWNQH